jgi:hypothetical protein
VTLPINPSPPKSGINRRAILKAVARAAGLSILGTDHSISRQGTEPIDLRGTSPQWGTAVIDAVSVTQPDGAQSYFTAAARLPVSYPAAGEAWSLSLRFENLLASIERPIIGEIADVGVSFCDARLQVWTGAVRTPGLRVLLYGDTVVERAPPNNWGSLLISVNKDGDLDVRTDDQQVLVAQGVFVEPSLLNGGPIDLLSRNSPVRWHDIEGVNLSKDQHTPPPWTRRYGEPEWLAVEDGGVWGYKPLKTHLWNRWAGQLMPSAIEYRGLRAYHTGRPTAMTHGPILGLPESDRIGVMVRTSQALPVRLLGGASPDPGSWKPLAMFATDPGKGYCGYAHIQENDFSGDAAQLYFGMEVDGTLVDSRIDGDWPMLKKRWLTGETQQTATIAATHCDNFYPAIAPLHSDLWRQRVADADLAIHLGDHVYEQGYRRRPEVSRLDYLYHHKPGSAQDWRGRLLPTIGIFDDHDLHNDVTGTGELGVYRDMFKPDGREIPADMPWRIASRDVGRAVWEEWCGWGTPNQGNNIVIHGTGAIRNGILVPDDFDSWMAVDDESVSALAPLTIWPDSMPTEAIEPECAGNYWITSIERGSKSVRFDAVPADAERVSFGVSTPRYGSHTIGNAEILLIDTRTSRTLWQLDRLDPSASMLGARQLAWLLHSIRQSTADVLFIASSNTVTFANEAGDGARLKRDSWTGYLYERGLIFDALLEREGRSVFLTGDLHNAAIRRLNQNIHEVICGSWSNIGFCDIEGAMRPVVQFPEATLLWKGPEHSPDCDWATYSTFFSTDRSGNLDIDVLNLAAEQSAYAVRL